MKAEEDPALAAERALVGASISSTDLALEAVGLVQVRHLHSPAHQLIVEAVVDLLGKGSPVSPNSVLTALMNEKTLIQAGGGPYLHTLMEQAALGPELRHFAGQVKRRAWKSGLAVFGGRCRQIADDASREPEEDLELLNGFLEELTSDGVQPSTKRAADLVYEVIGQIESGAGNDRVETGFLDLDANLSLRPGQLVVVGARPGVGKSTFGMDLARHVGIRQREPMYFLSLEMSAEELMKRMISAEGKISLHSILHHRADNPLLSEDDWDRMRRAAERIHTSGIEIDDTPGVGVAHIRARLRHMKRTTGVKLAVIDYLGILATSGRQENRQQAIAALTGSMKQLAREIGIPIVLLAQLNRQVEGRAERHPVPSDLKDSGAIEADADVVILLHRPDVYDRESPRAGEIDMQVDKSRHGPQFVATAAFQGHYCRIVDMALEATQSPAAKGHLRPVS